MIAIKITTLICYNNVRTKGMPYTDIFIRKLKNTRNMIYYNKQGENLWKIQRYNGMPHLCQQWIWN